jgi:hypothetical protein
LSNVILLDSASNDIAFTLPPGEVNVTPGGIPEPGTLSLAVIGLTLTLLCAGVRQARTRSEVLSTGR